MDIRALNVIDNGEVLEVSLASVAFPSGIDTHFNQSTGELTPSSNDPNNTLTAVNEWRHEGRSLAPGDEVEIKATGADGEEVSIAAEVTTVTGGTLRLFLDPDNDAVGSLEGHMPLHEQVPQFDYFSMSTAWNPTPIGYQTEFFYAEPVEEIPNPEALPDQVTGKKGEVVRKDVLANDTIAEGFTLVPLTLRLINPDTNEPVESVSIAGQGEHRVDGGKTVEFSPEADFKCQADRLEYVWSETNGDIVRQAGSTIQATILPEDEPVTPEPEPEVPEPQPVVPPVDEVTDLPPEDPMEDVASAGFATTHT